MTHGPLCTDGILGLEGGREAKRKEKGKGQGEAQRARSMGVRVEALYPHQCGPHTLSMAHPVVPPHLGVGKPRRDVVTQGQTADEWPGQDLEPGPAALLSLGWGQESSLS